MIKTYEFFTLLIFAMYGFTSFVMDLVHWYIRKGFTFPF